MAFYDYINQLLDPFLSPLLNLGPFWTILFISFAISIIVTLVYKWVTDQKLMKGLKDEIKEMQNEMKNHRSNPAKMMEMQKKAMEKNMKYMMHSMRPTLITFIPLILIFGWLSMNLAYSPIHPGERFDVYVFFENNDVKEASITVPDGVTLLSNKTSDVRTILVGETLLFKNPYLTKARYGGFLDNKKDIYYAGWRLEGTEGEHNIEFDIDNQPYYKRMLISKKKYIAPIEKIADSVVKGIAVDQKSLIAIDIFGLRIGWFWSYVIFSIVFSMGLRKVLKVY